MNFAQSAQPAQRTPRRTLLLILVLALVLRLVYALAQDHTLPYADSGGDTAWYLKNGYALVTNDQSDGPFGLSHLPTAPLYLVVIGAIQALLTRAAGAIIVIRLFQVLVSTGIVYSGYWLTRRITDREPVALLTAAVLAVSLALIVESAQILTETLYMGWLMAGLVVFVAAITAPAETPIARKLALAGVLLGLATLTRAVLLLFPLGLVLHVLLVRGWRTGWKQAALLLCVYALVVSTWTVYNLVRWNRFVVGAEGMTAFLYVGSRGWDDPEVIDEQLGEDLDAEGENIGDLQDDGGFLDATQSVIRRDPAGYVLRRVSELGQAYLQPHNTTVFGGESLKSDLSDWVRHDRTPGGLWERVRRPEFWPKLILYVFHFSGLVLSMAGMWLTRARWRVTLPLVGLVVYTSLLHLVMLALPRYIFPLYPLWWVFAACAIELMWHSARRSKWFRMRRPASLA